MINADTLIKGNLFSYCNNNPVTFVDHNGYTSTIASNEVILRHGPGNTSRQRFKIKGAKGAECSILFPIYDNEGKIVWLFIGYDRKQKDEHLNGYVKASDIFLMMTI